MPETMMNSSIDDDSRFVTSDATAVTNDHYSNAAVLSTQNNKVSNGGMQDFCCCCFFVLILSIDCLCAPNAILCSLMSLCMAGLFLSICYTNDGITGLFAFISTFNGVCVSSLGVYTHIFTCAFWFGSSIDEFGGAFTLNQIIERGNDEFANMCICFVLGFIHLLCWLILFLKVYDVEYLESEKGVLIKPVNYQSSNKDEVDNEKQLLNCFDFDEEKVIGI